VLILAGDHIYKMDYRAMIEQHLEKGADLTVSCIPVPKDEASRFGVAAIEADGRMVEFQEKHPEPTPMPSAPDLCLASMGVYLFNTPTLVREVVADAKSDTAHDFGKNIIPRMVRAHRVYAHDFEDRNNKPEKYWRDIGTRDSYWEANIDLVSIDPLFNLYDPAWPIRNEPRQFPPAKTVSVEQHASAVNSLLSSGCIVSGAHVERSILSPNVRIEAGSRVSESVIMDDCVIGRGCVIQRAIIDKRVHIPDGTAIGVDPDADARRFMTTTRGVVMVPVGIRFE
jgi:glucose-1-phosphate adenylyltransferase